MADAGVKPGDPKLPVSIPAGARVVVRVRDGVDAATGRQTYRDYVGHVESWDGATLTMMRDATADGRRPAERVGLDADGIVRLRPVPERPEPRSARVA